MQKKDHLMLAKYVLQNRKSGIPTLYQWAFLYGNIEPDINYLTYLHGFWKYSKFHGHHYENVRPVLARLLYKLGRKTGHMGLLDFFRLGKCMHYTADIFTFPHNKEFTGNIKEHCQYEEILHEHLSAIIGKQSVLEFVTGADGSKEESADQLQTLHDRYLAAEEQLGCAHDCSFILAAAQMLADEFLVPVLQPSYGFLSYPNNPYSHNHYTPA